MLLGLWFLLLGFFVCLNIFIWATGEPRHQNQLRLCLTSSPRFLDCLSGTLLHTQENHPTPSRLDRDTQLPKTARLQQGPLPAITLVSALGGRGRDTESSHSFRKSWSRYIYPRNSLSTTKPLPTVHLFPWMKHNCCWLWLATLQQFSVMSEQEGTQFDSTPA